MNLKYMPRSINDETMLVSNASPQTHQVAKEWSLRKEASPSMVNLHFSEKKESYAPSFYKSNSFSSHRNCSKGHTYKCCELKWKHQCIACVQNTSAPLTDLPLSQITPWIFQLCEKKSWDLFWMIPYIVNMLSFLLLWGKEISWPGIFQQIHSHFSELGECRGLHASERLTGGERCFAMAGWLMCPKGRRCFEK